VDELYRLPTPEFDSELVATLFEIERLNALIGGQPTTPVETFVELHQLFNIFMSVISARIEGNHTTVYEALEPDRTVPEVPVDEGLKELLNIQKAAKSIDDLSFDEPITHLLVRELHSQTVAGLTREGDPTPGNYRTNEVAITGSRHTPPSWVEIHSKMTDLLEFANRDLPLRQQVLQIALAHHRFVWIHPFSNGNGRVSRLFTYAMMRRTIFSQHLYRAINPTSVFGNERTEYVNALESADALTPTGTLEWATFFAKGIRDDLDRAVKLQDHAFVSEQLIGPVIDRLEEDGIIDGQSKRILQITMARGVIKAGDIADVVPESSAHRSRVIKGLIERRLLKQSIEGPRFYTLSLSSRPFGFRMISQLDQLGFLPRILEGD